MCTHYLSSPIGLHINYLSSRPITSIYLDILQSCICKNSEVKILALAGAMKGLLLSRLCMYLYLSRFVFAKIQACAHWPPSPRGLLHPKFESSTASVVPLPLPTKSQHPFQSIIIFIKQVDFIIITIIITLVIQDSATSCTITNHQTWQDMSAHENARDRDIWIQWYCVQFLLWSG